MSNQKNNQRLKDLLRKEKEAEDLDAFDREALEGFEMLGGESDALRMKEELDKKMTERLSDTRKHGTYRYWLAAAALLLLVGFTVYFVRLDTRKQSDLALQRAEPAPPQPAAQQTPLTPEPVNTYVEPPSQKPARAAERKLPAKESKVAGDVIRAAPQEPAASGAAQPVTATPQEKGDAEMKSQEQEDPEGIREGGKVQIAMTDSRSDESAGEAPAQREENVTAKKRKAAAAAFDAQPAAAQSPAAVTPDEHNIAFFEGGDARLSRYLREQLRSKGADKKFDAMVHINAALAVQKVELIRTYNLDKDEEELVKQVLLGTIGFRLAHPPAEGELVQYRIVYRP